MKIKTTMGMANKTNKASNYKLINLVVKWLNL